MHITPESDKKNLWWFYSFSATKYLLINSCFFAICGGWDSRIVPISRYENDTGVISEGYGENFGFRGYGTVDNATKKFEKKQTSEGEKIGKTFLLALGYYCIIWI